MPKAVNFDVPQLVLLAELEFDKKIDQALNKEIEELGAVTKALIEESGLEKLDKELQKEQEELDKGIDKWLQKELEDAAIKELLN
ncbi:MAG: hypothetical protein LKH34_05295 [Lactobacillus sp.]|nr:hypothetical protein [Lactobacillus sp.]